MNTSHKLFKSIFNFTLLLFISAVLFSSIRAAGEVDPTFNASAYNTFGAASVAIAQPDGKILIGGNFTVVNGVAKTGIIRVNNDGTLDTTFNLAAPLNGSIASIAFQSNGKILAGGNFSITGTNYTDLVRLNTDGSLDTSFVSPFSPSYDATFITDVFVRSDDTIYINGQLECDYCYGYVMRLDSNGNPDQNFRIPAITSAPLKAAVQPDGKVLVADAVIYRLNTDGSVDSTFTTTAANGRILKIIVQPDGKILIGGNFTAYGGFGQPRISRLNSNGSIDVTFNPNGTGANGEVSNIALAADGKIVISGLFTQYNGVAKNGIARLNADGTLDNSFNPVLSGFLYLQPDGKVLVKNVNEIRRLNADGTIDNAFNTIVFGSGGTVYAIVQQLDGKVIAGGNFTVANGLPRKVLARYNADGSLDTGFVQTAINDSPGPFALQSTVYAIALQSDGKILVGGQLSSGFVRLNADGSKDTTFVSASPLSIVSDIDILPDGRILVNGTYKLETNGSLSPGYTVPTFGGSTVATVAVVQPDGKFIIAGTFTQVNGVARGRIARLNADGTLDTTFNPPLGANGAVTDIDLQSDGKVVLIGGFTGLNGDSNRKYIGRLNSDGSLDTSFNPVFTNQPNTLKIQPDGKILIGGTVITVNGVSRNGYARLNSDGTLDITFNVGTGANGTIYRIALQTDNKILLGGSFTRINNVPRINIARLLNNPVAGKTLFDFDGDGKADLSVFRPSNAFWYVARPTGIPSQNFDATQFGISSDKLAPADYDGDGRTDIAVWRESSLAYFYVLQSQSGTLRYEQFGQTGDVPIPGDWDGDGKADLAVYRNGATAGTQSLFIYRPSSAPSVDFRIIYWGVSGDKPAVGDYDGDGKLDAAVFRPSSGIWYVKRSSDDQLYAIQFGNSGDNLVPADYDGDGKTDVAVFRPSNGVWYLQQSTAGFTGIQFGQVGDKPAPADYDGDRKADLAVFRDGIWYLQRSTAGFTGVQFGGTGDQPVPNAFVQ